MPNTVRTLKLFVHKGRIVGTGETSVKFLENEPRWEPALRSRAQSTFVLHLSMNRSQVSHFEISRAGGSAYYDFVAFFFAH